MTPPEAAADESGSGPAFAEPWQARAFAIAVLASRQGCFTWPEWTRALARELRGMPDGAPSAAERGYFDCWLAALLGLLAEKGVIGPAELGERRRAWEEAWRRTPHGMPVSLSGPP